MQRYLDFVPYGIFGAIVLLVLFPLYHSGYIFLLDFAVAPHSHASFAEIFSHWSLWDFLQRVAFFIPAALLQKILLTLILFFAAATMYRLALRHLSAQWATFAGILYLLNPWVYERFLGGQWQVLAGYALFPLCVHMCTRALESGRGRDWLAFVLFFAVYPLVSQHWAYMAALFLVALVVMHFSLHPKKLPELPLRKILQWGAGAVVVLGLVNTVWLFSFFAPTAPFVAISQTDFAAYQTKTDATVGVFGNVLALYGFWNTDFRLPKDTLPYWFALAAAIFALAATGAYLSCKKRELLGTTLTLTFVPVLLLAVGFASHATRPLTLFLYYHLPGFKGLRETDKLTGLLAFAYAYLAAMGARQAAQVLARHTIGIPASVVKKIVFVSLVAIPFLTVYTMFNGFDRQITPADYPASWYQANALLQSDTSKGNVLFLPWWGYLRFPFAHDVLVANPAVNFFDAHILAAARYENRHMPLVQTPLDAAIAKAIDGTLAPDAFVDYLRTQHVTHILLAQEEDTKKYNFLFAAVKLKKALDTGDLVLFSLPN